MEKETLSAKDYQSEADPRWCPGCGDYAILKTLTKTWAQLSIPKENLLVVSGIGCSSRLPYYTSGYGFHTLHGRGPTVALGAKMVNPDLSVWLVTGDGDALSIGTNHFVHLIRRNADVNVLLFNNEIYGLTKGQASPTSKAGLKTKTTPFGAFDRPMKPLPLALASGASFVARTVDANPKEMQAVFLAAARHKGTSVVEVLTNCIIFNDGAFFDYENKKQRPNATIALADGEPLLFGDKKQMGLVQEGFSLKKVDLSQNPGLKDKVLRHNSQGGGEGLQELLARLEYPKMPLATGIIRQLEIPVYEDEANFVEMEALKAKGAPSLDKILKGDETWSQ